MLFNSYIFIFAFLPLTLVGFFLLASLSERFAAGWLVAMSFVFYGWTQPALVPLLLSSALFNFAAGLAVQRLKAAKNKAAMIVATVGVTIDLVVLGYFKYADFLIVNIDSIFGADVRPLDVLLPLGVSFFTFTQIAYLVDCYQKKVREYNLLHYLLFVSYFPHLIAGPILHHAELMPQFASRAIYRMDFRNVTIGLTAFLIGLFKKVVFADGISTFVNPVFDRALQHPIGFIDAWQAALAYSLQIYFDFSGYCDMALGISAMFGVFLPINFWSPYKSASIIDFWRRWHITLSRFLRDYLYFPLGGNRRGTGRRYANLMVTMLLGGLWHGANWTFILWGGLHGLFLTINHGWRAWRSASGFQHSRGPIAVHVSIFVTYLAVVFAWVLFRAGDLRAAFEIFRGMSGFHSLVSRLSQIGFLDQIGTVGGAVRHWATNSVMSNAGSHWQPEAWLWIAFLTGIAWFAPNTIQIMGRFRIALPIRHPSEQPGWVAWDFTWPWLAFDIVLASVCVLSLSNETQFLYYRF